ncbi:hypothetical protein V8C86DRAFT_190507 [Haematococcus lacustris]
MSRQARCHSHLPTNDKCLCIPVCTQSLPRMPRQHPRQRIVFCDCFDCADRPEARLAPTAVIHTLRQRPNTLQLYSVRAGFGANQRGVGISRGRSSAIAAPKDPELSPGVSELAQLLEVFPAIEQQRRLREHQQQQQQEPQQGPPLVIEPSPVHIPTLQTRYPRLLPLFASCCPAASTLASQAGLSPAPSLQALLTASTQPPAPLAPAPCAPQPPQQPLASGWHLAAGQPAAPEGAQGGVGVDRRGGGAGRGHVGVWQGAGAGLGLPAPGAVAVAALTDLGVAEGSSGADLLLLHLDLPQLLAGLPPPPPALPLPTTPPAKDPGLGHGVEVGATADLLPAHQLSSSPSSHQPTPPETAAAAAAGPAAAGPAGGPVRGPAAAATAELLAAGTGAVIVDSAQGCPPAPRPISPPTHVTPPLFDAGQEALEWLDRVLQALCSQAVVRERLLLTLLVSSQGQLHPDPAPPGLGDPEPTQGEAVSTQDRGPPGSTGGQGPTEYGQGGDSGGYAAGSGSSSGGQDRPGRTGQAAGAGGAEAATAAGAVKVAGPAAGAAGGAAGAAGARGAGEAGQGWWCEPGGRLLHPDALVLTPRSAVTAASLTAGYAGASSWPDQRAGRDLRCFPVARPLQSWQVLGGQRVAATGLACPALVARRLPGVIRRDRAERFSMQEAEARGAGGTMLIDRLLPELAYKAGAAAKYGA